MSNSPETTGQTIENLCATRDLTYKTLTIEIFEMLSETTELLEAIRFVLSANQDEDVTWIDLAVIQDLAELDEDNPVVLITLSVEYGTAEQVPEILKLLTPTALTSSRYLKLGIPARYLTLPRQELVELIGQTIIDQVEALPYDDFDDDEFYAEAENEDNDTDQSTEFAADVSYQHLLSISKKGQLN